MKTSIRLALIALVLLIPLEDRAWACTTFILQNGEGQVYGSNHDWFLDDGLVVVNKQGCIKKSGKRRGAIGTPAYWTATYGSITFNQYGRDKPQGGMNEAGLVVEGNALRTTRYPEPDERPYMGTAQEWRQYLLDTCATVKEVMASDRDIRICPQARGLHLLVLDKSGDSALIEFIDGRMKVYTGSKLPVRVSSNTTYAQSLQCLRNGSPPLFEKALSVTRFMTAAQRIETCPAKTAKDLVAYSFDTLEAVSLAITQWRIVYDNQNMVIHFRTRANEQIRHINFASFDLSAQTPVKILDANAALSGDVSGRFSDYTYAANRDLIGRSFSKTKGLADVPGYVLDRLAKQPELFGCR